MAPRIVLAALAAVPLLLARPGAPATPAPAPRPALPQAATRPPVARAMDTRVRRGIDVSHHQGVIDWSAVAGDGVEFAWMKATEGATYEDPAFARNWREAGRAGVVRGAYHRFKPNREARVQARHFLATVRMREAGLPPVLDIEAAEGVGDAALLRGVRTWLAEVERVTGVRPIVYTRARFWRTHLGAALDDYPLWIAEYGVDSPSAAGWVAWQHSTSGRVAGIPRAVDLDRLRPGSDVAALLPADTEVAAR